MVWTMILICHARPTNISEFSVKLELQNPWECARSDIFQQSNWMKLSNWKAFQFTRHVKGHKMRCLSMKSVSKVKETSKRQRWLTYKVWAFEAQKQKLLSKVHKSVGCESAQKQKIIFGPPLRLKVTKPRPFKTHRSSSDLPSVLYSESFPKAITAGIIIWAYRIHFVIRGFTC